MVHSKSCQASDEVLPKINLVCRLDSFTELHTFKDDESFKDGVSLPMYWSMDGSTYPCNDLSSLNVCNSVKVLSLHTKFILGTSSSLAWQD